MSRETGYAPPEGLEKPIALEKGLILTPQDVERKLGRDELGKIRKGVEMKNMPGGGGYVFDKENRHVVVFNEVDFDPGENNPNIKIDELYQGYLIKEDSPLLEQ